MSLVGGRQSLIRESKSGGRITSFGLFNDVREVWTGPRRIVCDWNMRADAKTLTGQCIPYTAFGVGYVFGYTNTNLLSLITWVQHKISATSIEARLWLIIPRRV